MRQIPVNLERRELGLGIGPDPVDLEDGDRAVVAGDFNGVTRVELAEIVENSGTVGLGIDVAENDRRTKRARVRGLIEPAGP